MKHEYKLLVSTLAAFCGSLFSPPAFAAAPLVWSSAPTLPSPRAEAVAVLAPGGAVMLLGGTSPGGATVVPQLYPDAPAWSMAPALDKTRLSPGAVYSGPGILVIGGRNGNQPTDEVLNYDYAFGDSQDAAQMLVPRQQFAFGADGAGHAYVAGGLGDSGAVLASAESYDPGADVWTSIAPLPAARYGAAAVSVGGTNLYVFGGAAAGTVRGDVYRYVFATDSWAAIGSLPVAVRNAVAVFFEGRIYVTGGVSAAGASALVQVYDVNTGSWSSDTPLPAARSHHGAALDGEGQMVIAGGYDDAGAASSSVWRSQRLNVPETAPVFASVPVTAASLDHAYSYAAAADGNPSPTFSLVDGPAGMSVDENSGVVTWQPVAGQTGNPSVTLRATNRNGSADQSFTILVRGDTIAPTPPTEVAVVNVTASSVELSWSGATDANGVHHYAIFRQYRCGFRGIQRCYALVLDNLPGTTATVTGLPALTAYNYAIRAYDAAGNASLNSRLVSFKTLSPPVSFRYAGATNLPANFQLQLQFYADANPAATFSLVSGPAGLAIDPVSGIASWTPLAADVGNHAVVVQAENTGGTATLAVTLTVRPDAPQLSVLFTPGVGGLRDAVAGFPWTARIFDGSHTISTYEIVSAPTGMTMDAATGQLFWLPTPDDAGQKSVIVRAVNAASTTDISFEFYSHFTGPVTNVQVTGLSNLVPTATWTAPTGAGSDRTAGYTVIATARYRSGRAWRTQTLRYETDGAEPAMALHGLTAGRTYNLFVNAVDELDRRSVANNPGVRFISRPALAIVGWTITSPGGAYGIVAGDPIVGQFTDSNPAFGPAAYEIVSAPPGFELDTATGRATWTPTAADVGTVPIAIRVTNQIGPRDVPLSLAVHFSGPVQNAVAISAGEGASVSWNPPTNNVAPVTGYQVTLHWQVRSRSYSRSMTTTGTSLSFGLVPTGAVWHKGVTIRPLDATGRSGVATALIPYNNSLPAGLPPADPVWIENLALAADGTPVVEVRGLAGVVANLEVSTDWLVWDPVDTVTLDENGVSQCPDTAGTGAPHGFYRVIVP